MQVLVGSRDNECTMVIATVSATGSGIAAVSAAANGAQTVNAIAIANATD